MGLEKPGVTLRSTRLRGWDCGWRLVSPTRVPLLAGQSPGALPQSPIQATGWVAYRGTLTASERGREAGTGVGWGWRTAAEPTPGTPAPGLCLQPGAGPGSPQPWAPPGPPVRRLAGPGEPGFGEPIRSGFQTPGWSLEIAWGGGRPPRPPPQPLPGGASGIAGRDPRSWRVAHSRGAGRRGPSFLPPPRPAVAPLRCSSPDFAAPAGRLPGCGLSAAAGSVRGAAGAALRPGCIAALLLPRGAHAPRAPRSRPPGGSADRWQWAPGVPGAGALG